MKKSPKINSRYWIIFTFLFLVAIGIIGSAVKISIFDAPHWNKKAEGTLKLDTISTALPMRGSILAADGTPLAQTIALYTVYVDFKAHSIDSTLYMNKRHLDKAHPDTLNLDTLCTYLAENFPVKTKKEYEQYITTKRKGKKRDCLLAENISEEQYKELYNLSIFANHRKTRKGRSTGLVKTRTYCRYYPYGDMASILIGKAMQPTQEVIDRNPEMASRRQEWHGTSGMEKELDSLLFGQLGSKQKQQRSFGFGYKIVTPPVAGNDIRTTLDLSIQEIAERELLKMVTAQNGAYGTAIIMEVATGSIRALANVERKDNGQYTLQTRRNYAVTRVEPGSVIKTLSLLIAMENGHVDLNRSFDSHGAIPEIEGYKKIEPHKNPLTPRDVIVLSDNRGICKIITDNYRGRYNDYPRDIRNSGLMRTMELPLPDMQQPYVPFHHFGKKWEYYAFAQSVFGYHNELSPVTTLSVYNAIANNGRLMQPRLIEGIIRPDGTDSIIPPLCLNEHFCSSATAAALSEMLHGVVHEGTAIGIKNGRVDLAGKTGTVDAQVETQYVDANGKIKTSLKYDHSKRRMAFAGFFPYENPQYSCIVVIDKPKLHSAGRTAGAVMRAIAEEMYNRHMLQSHSQYKSDAKTTNPPHTNGEQLLAEQAYAYLGQYPVPDTTRTQLPIDTVSIHNTIPSVIGMAAKDALFHLEQQGFQVILQGKGHVTHQSPPAGTPAQQRATVTLTLN